MSFAYSLPKGGLVIQFESVEIKERELRNWPKNVFRPNEHGPTKGKETIGFLRNIDPRYSETQVQRLLEEKGCLIKQTKRCFHRATGKPMPIVKILFKTPDSLQLSLNLSLGYTYNRREAFIEKSKAKKVVRCFNCMRYGHISRNCSSDTVCENCGEIGHLSSSCKNQSKCANCSEAHPASSSNCTVYQEKRNQLQLQRFM